MSTEADKRESIELIRACAKQLRTFREDLIWALDECSNDPERSLLVREISYIHSTAHALIRATTVSDVVTQEYYRDLPVPKFVKPTSTKDAPDPTQTGNSAGRRRKHSDAFDLLLLTAVFMQPQLKYPVGLDQLHSLAVAFDADVQRPSLTSKLARWKKDNFLRWRDSRDMTLMPDGEATRQSLLKRCRAPGGRLGEVAATLNRELGLDPKFD